MLLEERQTIKDVYEVDRYLGEGAFAEVYRVKHKFLGRQALKVFKNTINSQKEIEQKLTEAIILSKIGHPNIIRVFDAGIFSLNNNKYGYFTMEYIAGGNLESFWKSHKANFIPLNDSIEIIKQICRGLAVAHSETPAVIHRDIKPQNILVGYDTEGIRVKIGDFGLARQVNPLTLLASAAGTPAFKPPEFLHNTDSCAGDTWAIGTIMYLLITDRLPFPVFDLIDMEGGKCWSRPMIPASTYNVHADQFLDAILARALALKQAERYPDAIALLKDLSAWKSGNYETKNISSSSPDAHKSALGLARGLPDTSPEDLVDKATELSQDIGKLNEAADLLEQAINRNPDLRSKYEYQLKLWRRGLLL